MGERWELSTQIDHQTPFRGWRLPWREMDENKGRCRERDELPFCIQGCFRKLKENEIKGEPYFGAKIKERKGERRKGKERRKERRKEGRMEGNEFLQSFFNSGRVVWPLSGPLRVPLELVFNSIKRKKRGWVRDCLPGGCLRQEAVQGPGW